MVVHPFAAGREVVAVEDEESRTVGRDEAVHGRALSGWRRWFREVVGDGSPCTGNAREPT
jgi:hypothetical protein